MRLLLGVLVGVALGSGGGYLVFNSRVDSARATERRVANELLRRLRVDGLRDADIADCSRRQADDAYVCSVFFGASAGVAEDLKSYEVSGRPGDLTVRER